MWKALSLTLALCLLAGCSAESETDGARCKLPPVWKIGEEEPMKNALGRVTVVAYLQASWLFCLEQASKWVQTFYFILIISNISKKNSISFMRPCFSSPYLVTFLIVFSLYCLHKAYLSNPTCWMFFKAQWFAPEVRESRLCKYKLHGGKQPRRKIPAAAPLAQRKTDEYHPLCSRPQSAGCLAGSKRWEGWHLGLWQVQFTTHSVQFTWSTWSLYYFNNYFSLNTFFFQVWPTHLPSVSSLLRPEPPTCGGGHKTYLLWWYLWRMQHWGKTAVIINNIVCDIEYNMLSVSLTPVWQNKNIFFSHYFHLLTLCY